MSRLTSADKAYAAGFFDGEGCVLIMPSGKSCLQRVLVEVGQVDMRPLAFLLDRFGGKIVKLKRRRGDGGDGFRWYLCGRNAIGFLHEIRPYLTLKAEQADVAFEFYRTVQSKGGVRRPLSPAVLDERERLRSKIKILKKTYAT